MFDNNNIINIDLDFDAAVKKASKIYFEGGVFIYPTDTIYGFGANPLVQVCFQCHILAWLSVAVQYGCIIG